mgnify:CR=1 FL=1|jgi:hypothetical protein
MRTKRDDRRTCEPLSEHSPRCIPGLQAAHGTVLGTAPAASTLCERAEDAGTWNAALDHARMTTATAARFLPGINTMSAQPQEFKLFWAMFDQYGAWELHAWTPQQSF